jgi:hypothetical protein
MSKPLEIIYIALDSFSIVRKINTPHTQTTPIIAVVFLILLTASFSFVFYILFATKVK